ncbi:tripartite tricarboxylate transporter TctB family protein [Marispirochaeta aestuarii]|uniref:tripartite tricarboxylate transporter TctB family protein n=1 Tax=Marispirochaeta aestuarii TaxID=1963862 RepID=UPI0013019D5A|nr:tripartite tricarboxylate transporter TctB family protein [Marispirochaeta aestuarii]
MTYRTNIVAGSSLSIFSVLYLYFSFDIVPFLGLGATPLDATFIPRFWGICLLALSLSLLLRGFRGRRIAIKEGMDISTEKLTLRDFYNRNYEVILTFVGLGVYTALLGYVGFTIMSILFIFFLSVLLTPPGKRNYRTAAIIAIVSSVVIDFLFVRLLSVLLPRGILGF